MSMVINTNVQATRTHGVYNRNTSAMNEAMTRVATAQRINSAKDGASIYAISERMRGQIRANDQANQNTQNDSALLKTAQGGISNTLSILNTLRERAINSANDSNLNTNRSDIAEEVRQLVYQIDDNANKVKFNGRTLLNGAVDTTVGKLYSAATVEENPGAAVSENPTAKSTHAVYNLTNLNTYDSSTKLATAAASNTNLTALVKSNATSAGDTLFQVGDKITFSWKENGNTVTATTTVASNTTLADLATVLDTADGSTTAGTSTTKALWKTAATNGTDTFTSDDKIDATNESNKNSNVVLNATNFDKLTAQSAGGSGIYFIGNKDKTITDFSVSVTYNGANGETFNRVAAQEAISFNAVQQSYGKTEGSNAVFSTNLYEGATDSGISGAKGNDTAFNELVVRGGSSKAFATDTASITFTINNRDYKVAASATIEDLNTMLKNDGVDIRAYLLNKGDTLKYGNDTVTRGVGDDATDFKATASGLYFVGGEGVDIQSIKFSAKKEDNNAASNFTEKSFKTSAGAPTDVELSVVQTRADAPPAEASAPTPLTFFIGGEPNFGMDVTINKMTSEALLGTKTVDEFAEKFLTKEGAQEALGVIDTAINRVLNEATKLGAIEARLGYTSDNLATMNENLEASDSVMRDADLAKEMTNYMKYSVLSQAAQYMLAQSGQNAFSVLNLLQQ